MAKNNSRKIKVTNLSYIAPLCQHGPIVTPTYVDESTTYKLVQRGYTVIEVEPLSGKECTLTISNFFKSNRFDELTPTKNPLNSTVTGKTVVGKAVPVSTIAKDEAIPFESIVNSTENSYKNTGVSDPTNEKPVVPFSNTQMSKAERKALAKQQREAARAEAEAKAKAEAEAEAKAEETEVSDSPAE